VDSLEEQKILEDLIESTKPPFKDESFKWHYLLSTPFRYPPLQNGSRFGTRFEPSFWYGSLELTTAMAETAYYRFNFLRASKAEFGNIITNHTVFSAKIITQNGIDLTQLPFSKFTSRISSPVSYEESQMLGNAMRQSKVESFAYQSARDPDKGINIALTSPKAFLHKKPENKSFQSWQCIINNDVADFIRLSSISNEMKSFTLECFLHNGTLPFPAN
ncbi:MAG: RES family NAD+ phosphorylase, partial [Gammaproteobacteria bacterium]|nr:RES family NAD+ phosphorylase [Gammaproteobacteria bacterium]